MNVFAEEFFCTSKSLLFYIFHILFYIFSIFLFYILIIHRRMISLEKYFYYQDTNEYVAEYA